MATDNKCPKCGYLFGCHKNTDCLDLARDRRDNITKTREVMNIKNKKSKEALRQLRN